MFNWFKKRAPVIVLDEGPFSSKVVTLGTTGKDVKFGVLRVSKYKNGKLHDYDMPVKDDEIGDPLVTIMFGNREGIKKMADALYGLYEVMEQK